MAALAAPTGARAADFSWSSPQLVNTQAPATLPNATSAVSCPDADDCAATVYPNSGVGNSGSVVTTTDAAAGAASWSAARLVDSHTIDAIACPSTNLCVAVDVSGDVLHSTNPFSSTPRWSTPVSLLPAVHYGSLDHIACPTIHLCVAIDGVHGVVYTTTAPRRAASRWHGVALSVSLSSLSCPSAGFCAVGTVTGNILTTTRPTGPAAAWSSVHIDDIVSNTFVNQLAVSCAGPTLCVAFDLAGRVFSSTDPAASEPTWTSPHAVDTDPVDPAVQTVSCPSTHLCVALGSNSTEFTSTDPASPNATWSSASLFTYQGSSSVTCPTTAFCIAAARDGDASTTTNPAGGGSTWNAAGQISGGYDTVPSVSCATLTLCVAVSSRDVDTSTAPAQNTWTIGVIDPSAPLLEVSCPDASLCVAIDADGYVFWSQNPAGGAATWVRSAHSIDTTAQITGLSCPNPQLCVAVDTRGNVLTSTSPVGGGWPHVAVDVGYPGSTDTLTAVSCAASFCVAGDARGYLFTTSSPAGGGATWSTGVLVGDNISSISCLAGPLCVATGPYEIASTINPTGGASAWNVHFNSNPETFSQPLAVSCAAARLCAGIGTDDQGTGYAIVSTFPRGPGSFTADSVISPPVTLLPGAGSLESISCASGAAGAQICAVGESTGHLITGSYPGTDAAPAAKREG